MISVWPISRLKFLSTEPMKYGANEAALSDDEKQPRFIRITDITEYGSLRMDTFRSLSLNLAQAYLLEDGDLLFARSGATVGKTFLYREAEGLACFAGYLIRFRCDRRRILPGFLSFFSQGSHYWAEIAESAIEATIQNVSAEKYGNILVPLPPIRSQQAIIDFLDRETALIDALIAAKERVLTLLAEKRKALITRAVMRGLDPNVPLRDSGIPWLGEIPAHWETRRIAWLFRERDERNEPELPLLEVSINSGVVLREFSDERIESTASDFNTYKIARRGDVVFNKMRMWQGAVGVAPEDGLVSPDYVVAVPNGSLHSNYTHLLFRTSEFSAECARYSHGIVWDRLRLYWDGFRDLEVPVPPSVEQVQIMEFLDRETRKLENVHSATKSTIALLKERRAALISDAVTGKLAMRNEK